MDYKVEESNLTKLIKPLDEQNKKDSNPLPKRGYYIWSLIAKRGQGKSTLILNCLQNKELYGKFFDNIYLISPTAERDDKFDALCGELDKDGKCYSELTNDTIEEIVDRIESFNDDWKRKKKKRKPESLIIFDDCIHMLPRSNVKNSSFNRLITTNRHLKTHIWIASQQFKKLNTLIRSNLDMITIFHTENVKEKNDIEEEFNIKPEIFDFATDGEHNFLHITFTNGGKKTYFKNFDKIVMK